MSEQLASIFSPDHWPFDLSWLPQPAYLVGGAVRDGLIQRKSQDLDLDFVVLQGAVQTARNISKHYKAGFVLLDAERQIARVVFPQATLDFAQAEGGSLEQDLKRRDFTVNAIAFDPYTQTFIDPNNGQQDLQRRQMRMISPNNLQDDPLRLLRAYRQAAQLGFEIETETQAAIREFAPLLQRVAVERIRTELVYLLNTPQGFPRIQQAWQDGLLSPWFPNANQHFDQLEQIEIIATRLAQQFPQIQAELSQPLRDTLKISQLSVAKLARLLTHNIAAAESELLQLKFSKIELKSALSLLKGLVQLQPLKNRELSLREQYFLFETVGILFPALAVNALAEGIPLDPICFLINRYFNPNDPVAHPQALLTGTELIEALKLRPSPKIGELLLEIQLAQIEGTIHTIEEAIAYAKTVISNQ